MSLNGHKTPADLSQFWVILVISNPIRYKRRYELYWDALDMCKAAGVNVVTVEQAFGERPFMVTEEGNINHLQVRSHEELWHKENMINMGIKHAQAIAPGRVKQVAWIDADCRPARPYRDWFEETWHQLQHYEFVQMWHSMIDLDNDYNAIGGPQMSFAAAYQKFGFDPEIILTGDELTYPSDECSITTRTKSVLDGRPGLAWAANIDAINKVGGLMDYCVLGAGDWYMAYALIGGLGAVVPFDPNSTYIKKMFRWQDLCERWIKRDIGFVSGVVYHDFHGKKSFRQYGTRGKILVDCQFDPDLDLKYDTQGMLQLETWEPRQIKLRDRLRTYFRDRNEDSIDL